MKKTIAILLAAVLAFSLCGCGDKDDTQSDNISASTAVSGEPLDLTELSSTMVYSEVYNMMCYPNDYIGREITMTGNASTYIDSSGYAYYSCIIADATACCSQGLEYVLADSKAKYPQEGETITVKGIFEIYYEGELMYCRLGSAQLL